MYRLASAFLARSEPLCFSLGLFSKSFAGKVVRMRKLLPVLLLLSLAACTRIDPGHVGIVVNMAGSQRGVADFTPTTGWVYYVPGKTQIFEYPTFVQSYAWTRDEKEGTAANEEITFTTRDALLVSLDVNISYSLDPAKVPAFYVKFRSDDIKQFTHGF